MFDELKPAIYENDKVDRDLLNMLINKIDTPFRVHVDQGISMHALETKYSNIKALDDPRAISQRYRKISNNTFNKQNNTNNNTVTTNNKPSQNNQSHNNNNNNNARQSLNGRSNPNHNAGPPQSDQAIQQSYNRPQPGQNQNSKPNHNNNYNNRNNGSRQTRMSHMSVDTQRNDSMAMEIGTLEENRAEEEDEINIMEVESTDEEDNRSLAVQTVHSKEEDQGFDMPILETAVNRFKVQLIFAERKPEAIVQVFGKKRIYISKKDLEDNQAVNTLRREITTGKIGVFSHLSDHEFYQFQKILEKEYTSNPKINDECLAVLRKSDNKMRFGLRKAKLKIFKADSNNNEDDLDEVDNNIHPEKLKKLYLAEDDEQPDA
ncbi:myb-like protein P [Anastrepha ludens]|uniref:myb-like protein P n=1 Tax=Anastrepha ludens TaxID=28586 RepID=UPI0023B1CF38|nr:myb-like protein P [Anastrepha ludens]